MSDERDELDALIRQSSRGGDYGPGEHIDCALVERAVELILAAGYRKPRTITTASELDTLPVGSAVIEASGDLCQRFATGWFGIIQEPHGDPWLMQGAEDVELPAAVLWEPTQ